ncbi:MAG: IS200/IS605 family transposase [Candidatus Doudnabacteria bacterium]|nr:IS200/IS605 family transposase [Candidatus Doudnabacteria bacterium]
MRLQHLNHSTYQHQYHIVWCTRGRRNILQSYVLPQLKKSFQETIRKYPTLFLHAMNTDEDHVHLQLEVPPNIAVSDAIRALKAESSLSLRKKFPFIKKIYLEKDGIWATGYFSSTIGLNEQQIQKYIDYQGKKEKPQRSRLW